jgi:hypothetical protein
MAAPAGGVIEGTGTIGGAFGMLRNAGAPVAGTNEVQTLTIGGTPTGGTFNLQMNGFTSGPITWSATNATLLANIQAAMDASPGFGAIANQVVATAGTLTAGIGTVLLTFSGANVALQNWPNAFTAINNLTGTTPTVTAAITTAGVGATHRLASAGQTLADTTNDLLYQNSGVPGAPVWSKVGIQT